MALANLHTLGILIFVVEAPQWDLAPFYGADAGSAQRARNAIRSYFVMSGSLDQQTHFRELPREK